VAVTLGPRNNLALDLLEAFEPHFSKARSIDGWLSDEEATALFVTAASIKAENPVVVEIGSYVGKSSVCIAGGLRHSRRGGRLFCVDPFDATDQEWYLAQRDEKKTGKLYNRFVENTWAYDNIIAVPGFSLDAVRDSVIPEAIDMLFIDGNHTYDAVSADIMAWVPYLKTGTGILAMHDVELPCVTNPDVIRVVADLGLGSTVLGWRNTTLVNTLYITTRTETQWNILASSQSPHRLDAPAKGPSRPC
jgi:predicted O-methyltransferase YrrM